MESLHQNVTTRRPASLLFTSLRKSTQRVGKFAPPRSDPKAMPNPRLTNPPRRSPPPNRHSPVTPRFSPNRPCPLSPPSILASSGSTEGGGNGAINRKAQPQDAQSGLALIALGTVLILANVGVVANFFADVDAQTIGAPAAATLAILQFLHNAAFDPAALLPFAGGILLLFLAFAGVFPD